MKKKHFLYSLILALPLALFLLTGCGSSKSGGGGGVMPPGPEPIDVVPVVQSPNYRGWMVITDTGAYKDMLRDQRACDCFLWVQVGFTSKCEWDNCGSMTGSPNITVDFEKGKIPTLGQVFWDVAGGSWSLNRTLVFNGSFQLINDSQGFSMQTQGNLAGYAKTLRFRVQEGQLGQEFFRMDVTYDGKAIGHVDLSLIR